MANVLLTAVPTVTATAGANLIPISTDGGTVISKTSLTDLMAGLTPTNNNVTPNATVPYDALVATGAATNIDVAVVPKGTGAFSLQIADGAITGGNKRGTNAVDLQISRTAATQVASGTGSFVAGLNGTATGLGAFSVGAGDGIGLGNGNSVTGQNAGAGGYKNSVSALESWALGGNHTVSGLRSFAAGTSNTVSGLTAFAFGSTNTASGQSSGAMGQLATTNGIQGQVAFGHNSNLLGGYQTTLTGLRQVTTGTTATRATADGATAATANQLTLRNNSVFKFMGRVVAYDLTTLDAKEWEFSGLIKRGANAAATSLVGTPSVTSQFADTAAAAWTVAVSADTTNGALAVTVTGAGANQIRWYVEVFAYETGV